MRVSKGTLTVIGGLLIAGLAAAVSFPVRSLVRDSARLKAYQSGAASRERAAELAWRREFGDPAELFLKFAPVPQNEAATQLLAVIRKLNEVKLPAQAVSTYVSAELRKTRGLVDAPPSEVAAFLDRHRQELGAVTEVALNAGPIVWAQDVSRYFDADSVLEGRTMVSLHQLMIAGALNHARSGDLAQAERLLEASWRINATMRHRPELVSQMLALAVLHLNCGLIRRIAVNPDVWLTRVAEHDYRSSFMTSAQVDALAMFQQVSAGPELLSRATRADFLEGAMRVLRALRDAPFDDRLGDLDVKRSANPDWDSFPGAIAATIWSPGAGRTLGTVNRGVLEIELVSRILAARAHRLRTGRWPPASPEDSRSRLPGAQWVHSVTADDGFTISFKRSAESAPELRYESSAPVRSRDR